MISSKQNTHSLVSIGNLEFYTVNGLEEVHQEMLRLLSIIDKICVTNNLNYWLDGGSLIGAIRHNGFIPWDDDLDISLLKDDYVLLISELCEYSKKTKDTVLFYDSPQKYHCCNYFSSTRFFCRMYGSNILYPVKIDIRPLNAYKDTLEEKENNLRIRDIANSILFNKSYNYTDQDDIPNSAIDINKFFEYYNNEYGFIKKWLDSDYLLSHPYFEFSNEFPLKLDQILPVRYVIFEGKKMPIPNNYDFLLTQLYGDYMSLPPLNNRAPVSCEVIFRNKSFEESCANVSFISKPVHGIFQKILRRLFFVNFIGVWKSLKIWLYE